MAVLCELPNNVADGGLRVQSRGSHAGGPRLQVCLGGRIFSDCRLGRRPSPRIGRTRRKLCRKKTVTKPGLAENGGARFSGVSSRENCEGRSKQNGPPRQLPGRQMNRRRVVDSRAIRGFSQAGVTRSALAGPRKDSSMYIQYVGFNVAGCAQIYHYAVLDTKEKRAFTVKVQSEAFRPAGLSLQDVRASALTD